VQRARRRDVLPEWRAPAGPARFRPSGQARGQAPPHSKPVGLWLRSSRQGLRGLRSPLPSMTQTTRPCGPRRPVYIFLLRAWCSVVLVSAFIVLPFMSRNAARRQLRDDGARAPRPVRSPRMVASKPGARRERSRDAPLRRRKRKRQRFISLVPSWYRYVLAFTGLAVLPASVRLSVWRTASCSLEEPWPQSGLIE